MIAEGLISFSLSASRCRAANTQHIQIHTLISLWCCCWSWWWWRRWRCSSCLYDAMLHHAAWDFLSPFISLFYSVVQTKSLNSKPLHQKNWSSHWTQTHRNTQAHTHALQKLLRAKLLQHTYIYMVIRNYEFPSSRIWRVCWG